MAHHKDEATGGALKEFCGTPGEPYRVWKKAIQWKRSSVPDDKQKLFAARIVSEALPRTAAELFDKVEPDFLRVADGVDRVFQILDPSTLRKFPRD